MMEKAYKGPNNIEDKVSSEDTVADHKDTLTQLVESDRLLDEDSISGSANPRSLPQTTPKHSTPRSREKGKESRPRSFLNRHEMCKPINRRGSHIRIGLINRSLWELFDAYSTEMLVNRRGRRMFPPIDIVVSGLIPTSNYILAVDLVPMGNWRYKFVNGEWVVSRPSTDILCSDCYFHPSSPATGFEWMQQDVSFATLKLTNANTPDRTFIRVSTMHHYQPRLHVIESSSFDNISSENVHTFLIPSTSFFPVTSYMNEYIIDLKIKYNKYAKGFQVSRESRPQYSEQKFARPCSLSPLEGSLAVDAEENQPSSSSATLTQDHKCSLQSWSPEVPETPTYSPDTTENHLYPCHPHSISSPSGEASTSLTSLLPGANLTNPIDTMTSDSSSSISSMLSSPSSLSSPSTNASYNSCLFPPVMCPPLTDSQSVPFEQLQQGFKVPQIHNNVPSGSMSLQSRSWRPLYLSGFQPIGHESHSTANVPQLSQQAISNQINKSPRTTLIGSHRNKIHCPYAMPLKPQISYLPSLPTQIPLASQGNNSVASSWRPPLYFTQVPQLPSPDRMPQKNSTIGHFQAKSMDPQAPQEPHYPAKTTASEDVSIGGSYANQEDLMFSTSQTSSSSENDPASKQTSYGPLHPQKTGPEWMPSQLIQSLPMWIVPQQ